MSLVDDMANAIRAHGEAFAAINNNDNPKKVDILNYVMLQKHRNLRDLLERYDGGER